MSILTTRPAGPADPLVAALKTAGHRVHAVPTVELRPVEPGGPLDIAASRLAGHDWVVVTSPTGASATVEAVRRTGAARLESEPPRWVAVGPATAAVLEAHGIRVSVVPATSRGSAITAALLATGSLDGRRVLLPRSDQADGALPQTLRDTGATVEEVVAYRTMEGPGANASALQEALADDALQAIVLCSGSAVRGLLALSTPPDAPQAMGLHPRVPATPLVSIGPATSEVIRDAGLSVAAEAPRPSVGVLVTTVGRLLAASSLDPTLAAPGGRS